MLELLLGYLYSAFDKNPYPGLALRVTHPDGFAWRVSDRTLTASTEAGAQLGVIGLVGLNVAQLANELTALGCAVIYQNPAYQSRSADTLLNGGALQSQTNGDHLFVYDSLVYALVDIYARHLETASADVMAAVAECYFDKADGEYLDEWGSYFAILRNPGEVDSAYFARIIAETLRPRNNVIAIENAIKSITGSSVMIFEPWTGIFRSSQSALSVGSFEDGVYWAYGVIQPQGAPGVNWSSVLPVIDRNRSAGVVVAAPQTIIAPSFADAGFSFRRAVGVVDVTRVSYPWRYVHGALDVMVLGDDIVPMGPSGNMYQGKAANIMLGLGPLSPIALPREIAKASICLSDGNAIGTADAILGAGIAYYDIPGDYLSGSDSDPGYKLSELVAGLTRIPFDDVFEDIRALDVVLGVNATASSVSSEIRSASAVMFVDGGPWDGSWDARSWYVSVGKIDISGYSFALVDASITGSAASLGSPASLLLSSVGPVASADGFSTVDRTSYINAPAGWVGTWGSAPWSSQDSQFLISTW